MTGLLRLDRGAFSGGLWGPRFDGLDRPATVAWRHPHPHLDHAQEVTRKAPPRGAHRWGDLGHEDWRPVRGEGAEPLEYPLEEERRFLERDVLIEEVRQRVQKDDEADRLGGQQRFKAFTQQSGELPAGEGAYEMNPTQEDVRGDPAGLGHGDNRHELERHSPIDEGY